jgi:RNA polymerase sigma-70 factor (ECF subfamily)
MDRAFALLRREYVQSGQVTLLDELSCFLPGGDTPEQYETLAAKLAKTVGAVKMALARLRRRYRDLLLLEVRDTLADPSEAEAELRYLFEVLRSSA